MEDTPTSSIHMAFWLTLDGLLNEYGGINVALSWFIVDLSHAAPDLDFVHFQLNNRRPKISVQA